MFYFDVVFKDNLPVTPLNANSDKMIFAVSMENQTFIRYIAADGTSMILHSFNYKADFVNASLSFDFRLLSLTEIINEDGNKYYSSRIYDIQNPTIISSPITSSEIIRGDIQGIDQYVIIYSIHGEISKYIISLQEDKGIILSKDRIKVKTKQIVWSHYSSFNDTLSVLSKNGENFNFYSNYIKNDTFFSIKSINEQNQDEKNFYSASFHEYYSLFQQCFMETSDYDQLHVYFFPQYKNLIINVPKNSIKTRLNCIQYYSVVFVFVPNLYICVIDIKEMKAIFFDDAFSKMPVSPMVTVYDEGLLCDNKEGNVYSTRINLTCFKNLSNENEINAVAIIAARIKCSNYFYIPPKDKMQQKQTENMESLNNERYNCILIEKPRESEKTISLNEFTHSSKIDIHKLKTLSDSEDDVLKNNSSRNLFFDSSASNMNTNDNSKINQTKSDVLMSSGNFQKNVPFKKSFSFDKNLQQESQQFFDKLSTEYQCMYSKIIVDKLIVSNILDYLIFPYQISNFIKKFIELNSYSCLDHPIPLLFMYIRKSHTLSLRIPLDTKKELLQNDKYFPTNGTLNRCEAFTSLVKFLTEEQSVLSINEAFQKAMDIIRRQNSLVLNLKDSFLMWQVRGIAYKFRKFLVTFCLDSELSFMNLPQIAEISRLVAKYSKKFFSKTIREMMFASGIYDPFLLDSDPKDSAYWKNRINVKSMIGFNSKPKLPNGKKPKEEKLIHTFTVPYFKIRNQKVFHVHHYSNIP